MHGSTFGSVNISACTQYPGSLALFQRADFPEEWHCMCDYPWLAWDVMYQESIGWRYLTLDLHAMTLGPDSWQSRALYWRKE
jgi:hypothetical protein